MKTKVAGLCLMVFLFWSGCVYAAPKSLVKRIAEAKEFLDDIMEAPDTEIPAALFEKCRGIIIMK
ncbi:MAG TPA: hypothetical protein PLP13_04630, partial [bacterium]|nr:hypothetical protein [bacterium]